MHRFVTQPPTRFLGNEKELLFPLAVLVVQLLATGFFLTDSIREQPPQSGGLLSLDFAVEWLTALAMLAGVVLSFRYIVGLKRELRWKEHALVMARGALADHIMQRFKEWGLTRGESDVALFALKGFDVAEIARLRESASGTVRSQLSQIYAKAGVSSRAELVSLFIDDLLDVGAAKPALG